MEGGALGAEKGNSPETPELPLAGSGGVILWRQLRR